MHNEECQAYEQKIQFVIGFAGSGKSTKLANSVDRNTLVLTPTHKAADVLINKGVKNVFTIHSVLKLVPTINENFRQGQKIHKLQKIGTVSLTDINKVVIDEFSMIPTYILDYLLSVLPDSTEVIIYGDPYQLPPVEGDRVIPEDYTADIIELTEQHRSKAPNATETFMRFMHYIKDGSETNLKVTIGGDIKQTDNWVGHFNKDTDKILAYTNAEVYRLNNIVAEHLGLSEKIGIYEDIIINGIDASVIEYDHYPYIYPTCISKGKLMDGDALSEAIMHTENNIDKFGTNLSMYNKVCIEINGAEYIIYADSNHYETSNILKKKVTNAQLNVIRVNDLDKSIHIAQWCKENRNAPYVKERGTAWNNYLKHSRLVFDMRRPFATTIHKSQGSEFTKVFIAQDDIKKSVKNNYYLQYVRFMYVALSRAIEEVYII